MAMSGIAEFIDFTSKSPDAQAAFDEVYELIHAFSVPQITPLMQADLARNRSRITAFEKIVRAAPGQASYSFTKALSMMAAHSNIYFSTLPIITSDITLKVAKLAHPLAGAKKLQHFVTYNLPDKLVVFEKTYNKPSPSTTYEYVAFFNKERNCPASKIGTTFPIIYLPHKLLAKLHKMGVVEEFKGNLATVLSLTNHDFLHGVYNIFGKAKKILANIKYDKPESLRAAFKEMSEAIKLYTSLVYSPSFPPDISTEELMSFALNSQIFHSIKRLGIARDLATAANNCMDILSNPEIKNSKSASEARALVHMLVSNYVDKGKLGDDYKNWGNVLMTENTAGNLPDKFKLFDGDGDIIPANFPFLMQEALKKSVSCDAQQQELSEFLAFSLRSGRPPRL